MGGVCINSITNDSVMAEKLRRDYNVPKSVKKNKTDVSLMQINELGSLLDPFEFEMNDEHKLIEHILEPPENTIKMHQFINLFTDKTLLYELERIFNEIDGDLDAYEFFRDMGGAETQLDKILKDHASETGTYIELPILNFTGHIPLHCDTFGDLGRYVVSKTLEQIEIDKYKLPKLLKKTTDIKYMMFCDSLSRVVGYALYNVFNLLLFLYCEDSDFGSSQKEYILTEQHKQKIQQINDVKDTFKANYSAETRAKKWFDLIESYSPDIIFVEELDVYLKNLLESSYFVHESSREVGIAIKSIHQNGEYVSEEQFRQAMGGINYERIGSICACKFEDVLLVSMHGKSGNVEDAYTEVEIVSKLAKHLGLRLVIGTDSNVRKDKQGTYAPMEEYQQMLKTKGLVPYTQPCTTHKMRKLSVEHNKVNVDVNDGGDLIIVENTITHNFPEDEFNVPLLPNDVIPSDHMPLMASISL